MTAVHLRKLAGDFPAGLLRSVAQSIAPLWLSSVIATEVGAEFDRLNLNTMERYFTSRAAPLGAASAPLVVSTFYNFSPAAVESVIPSAWRTAGPHTVLEAQRVGIDLALRRAFAELDPAILTEMTSLLREAALAAAGRSEGRPLFAAYTALEWPEETHLQLWHAHYLLREFRGDGHIAALVAEGLTGLEALVLHAAQVPALGVIFRYSRGWTDEQWNNTVADLTEQGWLANQEELALSELGMECRETIEQRTDELDMPGWTAIGAHGCERLLDLAEPVNKALSEAGLTFSGT